MKQTQKWFRRPNTTAGIAFGIIVAVLVYLALCGIIFHTLKFLFIFLDFPMNFYMDKVLIIVGMLISSILFKKKIVNVICSVFNLQNYSYADNTNENKTTIEN